MSLPFPAQMQEEPPLEVIPLESTDPLTLAIRAKFSSISNTNQPKYRFTKNYHIINVESFNHLKQQFINYLRGAPEGETSGFQQYYPLIFGLLEGTSANVEPIKILSKYFGEDIEKIQLEQILKEKTKSLNYGNDKRKESNIREISDKKLLESIGELFDLKEIKAHRRSCNSLRNYLKAYKRFKDCMQNTTKPIYSQDSEENRTFMQFVTEQIHFNKLTLPKEFTYQAQDQVEEKIHIKQEGIHIPATMLTPLKEMALQGHQKYQTASQSKSSDNQKKEGGVKQKSEEEDNVEKGNIMEEKESRNKKTRRSKQEIERDRLVKQNQKEEKKRQQEAKRLQKVARQNELQRQKEEKERVKQLQRTARQKQREARLREKEEKERERQSERLARQAQRLARQAERIAKQTQRQNKQRAKEQKARKQQQIMKNFFKPKKQAQVQKNIAVQSVNQQERPSSLQQSQKQRLLSLIRSQVTHITQCRSQFKVSKMKEQASVYQLYYANIVTGRSRLQFKNYRISDRRFQQYYEPYAETEMCKYDDSSVEYEDLCGDICNEEDIMSQQQEASFNSAIVNDSYISQEQLSSVDDERNHVLVSISQGAEWCFYNTQNKYADRYTMFSLCDDQNGPLPLEQPEESNQPSIHLKCDLYKEIHGYFGPKDPLIRKLSAIADRIPKSNLDTMLRQTTTKKGNQRLVKPEIIDFLNEQKEGFAKELEQIKSKRDEENMAEMRGKVSQKQREMQRLILNEAGTYYIIDLLHFLREKGYRMRKRDLTQFIDARRGSEWDDIRRKMKKMNLKEKEKINKYFNKKEKEGEGGKEEKESEEDKEGQNMQDQNGNAMKPQ